VKDDLPHAGLSQPYTPPLPFSPNLANTGGVGVEYEKWTESHIAFLITVRISWCCHVWLESERMTLDKNNHAQSGGQPVRPRVPTSTTYSRQQADW
jgi:hypothetical protein